MTITTHRLIGCLQCTSEGIAVGLPKTSSTMASWPLKKMCEARFCGSIWGYDTALEKKCTHGTPLLNSRHNGDCWWMVSLECEDGIRLLDAP